MLAVFLYAFNAVAPILLLILLGYFLRVKRVFTPDFFKNLNRFAFYYCFPALMFQNLYQLGGIREIDLPLAGCILFSSVVLTLAGFVIAQAATKERTRKGVLIQATFRSNYAIIGLPLSEGLAGAEALAVTASMQAPTIIYFNVASILALCLYGGNGDGFRPKKVLEELLRNPLLQGLGAGLAALVARELLPAAASGAPVFTLAGNLPWLYTLLGYLARVATPLCLIALGGQFRFSDVPGIRRELVAGVAARLFLAPAIGFAISFAAAHMGLITLNPATLGSLIPAYASPTAVSGAAMAAEMGADDKLASQIVVWSSLISMGTIFLLAVLFRTAGML